MPLSDKKKELIARIEDVIEILNNMKCATDFEIVIGHSTNQGTYSKFFKYKQEEEDAWKRQVLWSAVFLIFVAILINKFSLNKSAMLSLAFILFSLVGGRSIDSCKIQNSKRRESDSACLIIKLVSDDERNKIKLLLKDLEINVEKQSLGEMIFQLEEARDRLKSGGEEKELPRASNSARNVGKR